MAAQRDQRRRRFERTVERLRELGLPIDAPGRPPWTRATDDALGRPTIARALMAAGYAASVEDAFSRLIGHGAPGYVRARGSGRSRRSRRSARAGGHAGPRPFPRGARRGSTSCASSSRRASAGSRSTTARSTPATVVAVGEVADRLGLVATGGTDYHGDLGPYAEAHAALWVPPEVGERLLASIARGRRPRTPQGP